MNDRIWAKHPARAALCFGAVAAVIYALMVTVTLARLEALSGQVPFDLRPMGYSPQEAAALLEGLGAEGRASYLGHQIPLDTAYPALLALTLISLMRWLGQAMPARRLVRVGIVVSVAAALCDYGENLGIIAMVLSWPDLSDWVVHASSIATVAKSVLTTGAVVIAIVLAGVAAGYRLRRVS